MKVLARITGGQSKVQVMLGVFHMLTIMQTGHHTLVSSQYATPEDGLKDVAKTILGGGPTRKAIGAGEIKAAIAEGNLRKAVFAQHANGYFQLPPEQYLASVIKNYDALLNNVRWPKVLSENGITPAVAAIGGGGLLLGLGLTAIGILLLRKPWVRSI